MEIVKGSFLNLQSTCDLYSTVSIGKVSLAKPRTHPF